MRKMKKINGFLVVKFNSRELREWGDMGLGNFGIIDAEIYTGKLEIDRGAMEYDDIETIEEAVEMARGLNAEEDYTAQPSTYAVVEEVVNDVVERVEVDPQFLIDRWTKTLKKQIKSPHHPGVNANTARHELYGFKVALSELGLLDADECLVFPNAFGPEGPQPQQEREELLACVCDTLCKERIPGRTQEELHTVCAKCDVNPLTAAFGEVRPTCKAVSPDALEKPLVNQKSPVDRAVLVGVIPYREASEEEAKKLKDALIKMIMSGVSSAAEPGLQSRKCHEEQMRKCLNDAEKRLSHFCLPPSLR